MMIAYLLFLASFSGINALTGSTTVTADRECQVQFVLWDVLGEKELGPIEQESKIDLCPYMETTLGIEYINSCADYVKFQLSRRSLRSDSGMDGSDESKLMVETEDFDAPFFMSNDNSKFDQPYPSSLELEEGDYVLQGNADSVHFTLEAQTC